MKKRITVNINEDTHRIVAGWLKSNGLTFSGFLTVLLDDFANVIEGEPHPLNKPVAEMNVKEFCDVVGYWFNKVTSEA